MAHHYSQSPVELKAIALKYCVLGIEKANALGDFRVSVQSLMLCKLLITNSDDLHMLEQLLDITVHNIETHVKADNLQSGRKYFLEKCQVDCVKIEKFIHDKSISNSVVVSSALKSEEVQPVKLSWLDTIVKWFRPIKVHTVM